MTTIPTLTIFVAGPPQVGKTTISNFLENTERTTSNYHPTQGVRILEFEKTIPVKSTLKTRDVTVNVELWDLSGNANLHNCWSAVSKVANVHGAILVYSPNNGQQEQDLETWHALLPSLKDDQFRIFAHWQDKGKWKKGEKPKLGKSFGKIHSSYTSIVDAPDVLKKEFEELLIHAYTKYMDNREKEEAMIHAK